MRQNSRRLAFSGRKILGTLRRGNDAEAIKPKEWEMSEALCQERGGCRWIATHYLTGVVFLGPEAREFREFTPIPLCDQHFEQTRFRFASAQPPPTLWIDLGPGSHQDAAQRPGIVDPDKVF